jgi:hypothetical protein
MADIILCYRVDYGKKGEPVETYARCLHRAIEEMGHGVLAVGEGHGVEHIEQVGNAKDFDLFLDLDCGRNNKGDLHFQGIEQKMGIPKAVWFIDSHGYPSLHKRSAKHYDYVFFAVWRRRDLFANHNYVVWCPNATSSEYFDFTRFESWHNSQATIGFFGSKGGLNRADVLKSVCNRHGWSFDIREIGRDHGHRWPATGEAMSNCKILYNQGQKHDGPNQRVMESMMINKPLINNRDKTDGMSRIFEEGDHYLGFENESELADQIRWCNHNYDLARKMAGRAYKLVKSQHLIEHRASLILEHALV